MKNKALFYILSFTWGIPMTLIGLIVALALVLTGHKAKLYGGCFHFIVGKNWGGLSLGIVIITCENSSERTKNHEVGHAIQNCKYGFLMPFIVCIPSAIRYWYREFTIPTTDYDGIWFEAEATRLGCEYIKHSERKGTE